MSSYSNERWITPAHRPERAPEPAPPEAALRDESIEFVRFCYRRRRVGWPGLYDEMCAVAARGAFRGLGYAELAERGILFGVAELPRLVALTERVIAEEAVQHESRQEFAVPMMLSTRAAQG